MDPSIEIKSPSRIHQEVLEWGLGPGETEVISLALETPSCQVILDDRMARKCARAFALDIRGTVGLVILAKQKGTIALARPVIQKLIDSGIYFSDEWLRAVLALVDESWP